MTGKGESKTVSVGDGEKGDFIMGLMKAIKATPGRTVIISPSMSGTFSLPYLFTTPEDSVKRAAAFVPVAPAATKDFTEQYPKSQVRLAVMVLVEQYPKSQVRLAVMVLVEQYPKSQVRLAVLVLVEQYPQSQVRLAVMVLVEQYPKSQVRLARVR